VPPFWREGELDPHLTQCGLGRSLPPCQLSSIFIHPAVWPQQTWAENCWAVTPFSEGEGLLDPHLTQCGLGRGLPPYQVSYWSIQPFGHNTRTPMSHPGRQTAGQRSDSIGRTVLQTVVQKRHVQTSRSFPHMLSV